MHRLACVFVAGITEKKYENLHVLKGSCRLLKSNLAMQVFPTHDCMRGHSCLSGLSISHYQETKSQESLYTCTDLSEPSMLAYTKIVVSTMQRV